VPDPVTIPVEGAGLVRRRSVVLVTLVVEAVLLGFAFAESAGSQTFYLLTLGLAATGVVGGLLSGPIPLAEPAPTRANGLTSIATAIVLGLAVAGVFVAGAAVVDQIGPLRGYITEVVDHTHQTTFVVILAVTVVNAVAEEIFFRGAVYAAAGWQPVAVSTVVYVATVAASGNVALGFAAAVLGLVLAGQRRITGGVLGPAVTHVTWSVCLLLVLPALF
jgi:membrane protease YdiL (CAAX protease family)